MQESRNIEIRHSRYINIYDKVYIDEILNILKIDTPFVSLLPYQKETLKNVDELFKIKDIIWYNHKNDLLYSLENGMYVYLNFSHIYTIDSYYTEDFEVEHLKLFITEDYGSIIKYAMSEKTYQLYLNQTEEFLYERSWKIRKSKNKIKKDEINFIEDNLLKFSLLNYGNDIGKIKLSNFCWVHLDLDKSNTNYVLCKNENGAFLLKFKIHYQTNFYGMTKMILILPQIITSDRYEDLIESLSQEEYEMYINESI